MTGKGTLFLIPVFLGPANSNFLSQHLIQIVHDLKHFIVEDEKTARGFLKALAIPTALPEISLSQLNEHTASGDMEELLSPLLNGHDCGLMSEAGSPGIADPGSELIFLAHRKGIKVVPLAGPSSILLGLMASGMNGQYFSFNGYLSRESNERCIQLKELEKKVIRKNETQLFIETPYRNAALLEDIKKTLQPETLLCIACNINAPEELIFTQSIREWKSSKLDFQKKPCIFIIGQPAFHAISKRSQASQHRQRQYRK